MRSRGKFCVAALWGALFIATLSAARGQSVTPETPPPASTEVSGDGDARGIVTESGLVYVERDERSLRLDLYRPGKKGPHPWVIVIHGGGWSTGSRSWSEAPVIAKALAARGIAAACPSYRLAPKHVYPAQIEDCRRALQWLRHEAARFDLDPKRAGAVGASAGGHLAALLGLQDDAADPSNEDTIARESSRVRAVVAYCAPMDLEPRVELPPTPLQARLVCRFLGVDLKHFQDSPDDAAPRAKARSASPRSFLDAADPPLLLVNGEKDQLVPIQQARLMAGAAAAAHVQCEVIEIPGGGHGNWIGPIWEADPKTAEDYWNRSVRFLEQHLAPR